jgi:hypothetical protein
VLRPHLEVLVVFRGRILIGRQQLVEIEAEAGALLLQCFVFTIPGREAVTD